MRCDLAAEPVGACRNFEMFLAQKDADSPASQRTDRLTQVGASAYLSPIDDRCIVPTGLKPTRWR